MEPPSLLWSGRISCEAAESHKERPSLVWSGRVSCGAAEPLVERPSLIRSSRVSCGEVESRVERPRLVRSGRVSLGAAESRVERSSLARSGQDSCGAAESRVERPSLVWSGRHVSALLFLSPGNLTIFSSNYEQIATAISPQNTILKVLRNHCIYIVEGPNLHKSKMDTQFQSCQLILTLTLTY